MKNPLTPAGIKPATFRFVAQHPNHCATVLQTERVQHEFHYVLVLCVSSVVKKKKKKKKKTGNIRKIIFTFSLY